LRASGGEMANGRGADAPQDGAGNIGRYVRVGSSHARLADCSTLPMYVFRSGNQPYRWWEDEPEAHEPVASPVQPRTDD